MPAPERNLVKSKFIITVTSMQKIIQEDGTESFKTVGQINEEMSRQEFKRSMYDDKINGIDHKVEIVNKKPEQFQFNMLYILADGSRMWVWIESDNDITSEEAQAINDAAAGEQQVIESEGEN